MELIEVVNTQYAFPVGMVIIIGVLVFAFGFKSAQEPPFDQLTFPADDRKPAGKKRKLKDKKPQPNGHVTTQPELVQEKPVEKESSSKVTPRQHKKEREKDRKSEKVQKQVMVEQKPDDFDEGQWVQAVSRREKKNKNKKVVQSSVDDSVERVVSQANEEVGDSKQMPTDGTSQTTEGGSKQLLNTGATLTKDDDDHNQLPAVGTTEAIDRTEDKQLLTVGSTEAKDGASDKQLLTIGSATKVSTPSKKKKKKSKSEDLVEEQIKNDISPAEELEKLEETTEQPSGGYSKKTNRNLKEDIQETDRQAVKSVDGHTEADPSAPEEGMRSSTEAAPSAPEEGMRSSTEAAPSATEDEGVMSNAEGPAESSEQQPIIEKRSPRKKKDSRRLPDAESHVAEGNTVETSPAVSKRRKKKKSQLTSTEHSTKNLQEPENASTSSSSMLGHIARASDDPSISADSAPSADMRPLPSVADTEPKTDLSSSTPNKDISCPSNDVNKESSEAVVHKENMTFDKLEDVWKEAKPQKKKRKVRRDQ